VTERTYRELYAPGFVLSGDVPGVNLRDIAQDVISLEYEDSSKGMDVCNMVLRNVNHKYANDRRFLGPMKFRLRFGYADNFSDERVVVVRGVSAAYDAGMPVMALTAYDVGAEMSRGARPHNWGRVSSSTIAGKLAAIYGLSAEVEESGDARDRVQPGNVSSYEYLLKLAQKIGFDFYVRGQTLYFHRMRTDEAALFTYHYFTDGRSPLLSFSPEVKQARPPAVTHANTSADGEHGASSTTGRNAGDERAARSLTRYRTDFSSTTGRVVEAPVVKASPETDTNIQRVHARAEQTRIEMSANTATAVFLGQPRLTARRVIKIVVPEQRWSGLWRIEKASHSISANAVYTTRVELSRTGANKGRTGQEVPTNQQNQHQGSKSQQVDRRYRTSFETVQGEAVAHGR
jgi:phage protein D